MIWGETQQRPLSLPYCIPLAWFHFDVYRIPVHQEDAEARPRGRSHGSDGPDAGGIHR